MCGAVGWPAAPFRKGVVMEEKKVYVKIPEFTGENVPVAVAARVMKKDPQFVRQGIIQGFLKFGVAFKKDGSSTYDYYISPMKFWQETGYIYKGEGAEQEEQHGRAKKGCKRT